MYFYKYFMVKSVQVTFPPNLRYTEEIISKLAICGPKSDYFMLRTLRLLHEEIRLA
jgi:hypothetical protein